MTAIALFEEAGDAHAAARTSADLAGVEFSTGRLADAIERMERAYGVLEDEEPDEDLAFFLSQLRRAHYFAGNHDLSEERNERALAVAERLRLLEVLLTPSTTRAFSRCTRGAGRQPGHSPVAPSRSRSRMTFPSRRLVAIRT